MTVLIARIITQISFLSEKLLASEDRVFSKDLLNDIVNNSGWKTWNG
jgi:hypothetical protein